MKRESRHATQAAKLEKNLRKNNLKQQLESRPHIDDTDTIVKKGGAKCKVAPKLQSAKVRLEREFKKNKVAHLLESRADYDELQSRNIVRANPVANRLQSVQKKLAHNMTTNRVGHLLEQRAEATDLHSSNIMHDQGRVAPRIQGPQRALQRNLAKANLYHALKHRPSIADLQERGVYIPGEQLGILDDYGSEEGESMSDFSEELSEDEPEAFYQVQSKVPAYDSKGLGDQYAAETTSYEPTGYQRRSKYFHLTRILLKYVASMAEAGDITLQQKGVLKDLIVDQDKTILAVAETFDTENDLSDFKDSLVRLASRG